MAAGEVKIHHSAPLRGVFNSPAFAALLNECKFAYLGFADKVKADDLDGRLEPVGIFALIGRFEVLPDRRQIAGSNALARKQHFRGMFLVAIAEAGKTDEFNVAGFKPLGIKLGKCLLLYQAECVAKQFWRVAVQITQKGLEVVTPQI